MKTSPAGQQQLIADEGEVLKAYRDVVGVWTIGVGLTKASGVVHPKPGMVITRAESRRLLGLALSRNYEPAVNRAMPGAKQYEFDGGLGFHFNTGAVERATWVKLWGQKAPREAIRRGLMAWDKAGGKVVPGLTKRRARDAALILEGRYAHGIKSDAVPVAAPTPVETPLDGSSRVLRRGSKGEAVLELQTKLKTLKLYTGNLDGDFGAETETAVRRVQKAHKHLTEDGVAGPATRDQIQRMLDAGKKIGGTAGAGTVTSGSGLGADQATDVGSTLPIGWLVGGAAVITVLIIAYFAFRYRDEIGAWWTTFKEEL